MLFTYLYISTCGFLMNAWFYKIYDIYHMDNQVIQNVPLQYDQKYWFSLSTFVHKSYIPIVHLQFFAFLNGLIHQNLFNEKKSFETDKCSKQYCMCIRIIKWPSIYKFYWVLQGLQPKNVMLGHRKSKIIQNCKKILFLSFIYFNSKFLCALYL